MRHFFRRTPTVAVAALITLCAISSALAQTSRTGVSRLGSLPPYHSIVEKLFPLPESAWDIEEPCFGSRQKHTPRSARSFFVHEEDIHQIDLDGLKKILQRDPKDTRPLLVNFWATWCDSCREEFPDLVKLDNDYRTKGLNFLAVSLDELSDIKSAVPQFLKEMKATMPVVLLNVKDPEPAIKIVDPTWDGQLPATFLYDNQGKIVFKHFGRIQPLELRAAIDKELNRKQ